MLAGILDKFICPDAGGSAYSGLAASVFYVASLQTT
jgi:hypothetical protein